MHEEQEQELRNTRRRARFVFKQTVEATFNASPVRLCNISGTGVQIEHPDPLKHLGMLVVILPRSIDTISLRGEIVWSRLGRTPNSAGEYLYRSGIKFDGQGSAVAATVQRIITIYSGEEDRETLERMKKMLREKGAKQETFDSSWRQLRPQKRIDPDKEFLIEQVLARLKKEPDEIARRAGLGRRALERKGQGFIGSDETLAVWQYLEELVPVSLIAEVLSKDKH